MADPAQPSSPLPDDPRERAKLLAEKKAELDEIAGRREKLLDADRQRKEHREQEATEQSAREQQSFAEEAQATKERAEGREEWRQGQHEKRREAEKVRWKAEEQKRLDEEKRKKIVAEKAKQQEYLDELHRRAYRKKVENKLENAELQEHNENKNAQGRHDREMSALEVSKAGASTALQNDKKRQIQLAKADAERRRKLSEDGLHTALADIKSELAREETRLRGKHEEISAIRTEAARKRMQLEAIHKREMLTLDESLATKLQEIELIYDRLAQESGQQSSRKEQKIDNELSRKKDESAERRHRTEEWIQKGGAGHD
jgi:hypothetical protein